MHHVSAVLLANETLTGASTGCLLLCGSIYGAFVTGMKGLSYHCDNQPTWCTSRQSQTAPSLLPSLDAVLKLGSCKLEHVRGCQ